MQVQARSVGREDAARELVVAGRLGGFGERIEQLDTHTLPASAGSDVDRVLAHVGVGAPGRVGGDAGEAEDRLLVVDGDKERAAFLQPARDLVGPPRPRLERRLALGDAVVVDRGDGVRILRLGGDGPASDGNDRSGARGDERPCPLEHAGDLLELALGAADLGRQLGPAGADGVQVGRGHAGRRGQLA